MFEQALKVSVTLSVDQRDILLNRLNAVCDLSQDLGYGVVDDMNGLLAKYDREWPNGPSIRRALHS